jgi:hypothetical protein
MASNDTVRPSARYLPVWQSACQAVLKEPETNNLFKLVEVAEAAVRTRLAELRTSLDHHSERRSLQEAVRYLQIVKRERLKYEQQYFPD